MIESSSSIKFVSYLRVSTIGQEISGLGLQSQREMVARHVYKHGVLLKEFVETESGKNNQRIQLNLALNECRMTRAVLIIAKLDRLSRDASFLINLQKSEIEFVCCDMPQANKFVIGIMALLAQQEREMISSRTKAALAILKSQGVKMGAAAHKDAGSPTRKANGFVTHGTIARARSLEKRRAKTLTYAKILVPLIKEWKSFGFTRLQIISELNSRNIGTVSGKTGTWSQQQIDRLMRLV